MIQIIQMFICAIFSVLPFCVFAGSVQDEPSGELALVTADNVNLRVEPSLSAPIKAQFEFFKFITATNDIKNSEGYSWRRVTFSGCWERACCPNGNCSGWVADKYIALVSSFIRITSWKEQFLTDYGDGDSNEHFHMRPDGTFEYRIESNGGCGLCQIRRGNFCESAGVILRKNRLVLLRFEGLCKYNDEGVLSERYYPLYIKNETNQLCSHAAGVRDDVCTE